MVTYPISNENEGRHLDRFQLADDSCIRLGKHPTRGTGKPFG
jgi:hypothetical protein